MKLSSMKSRRRLTKWIVYCALVIGLVALFGSKYAISQENKLTDEAVATVLDSFFEVFLNRPLSEDDRTKVMQELFAYHDSTRCEGKCVNAIEAVKVFTSRIKTGPDQPESILARHAMISLNYFDPKLRGSFIVRLLTEPDPVRVVDSNNQRLMTESDLIAVVNLLAFLETNADKPTEQRSLSLVEIGKLADAFNRAYGDQAPNQKLPISVSFAAEFWTGLRREWPKLSQENRQAVRGYLKQGGLKPMPVQLYQSLFGFSLVNAEEFRLKDQREASSRDINNKISRLMGLQADAAILDQLGKTMWQPFPSPY